MKSQCPFCWKERPVSPLPCPFCGTAIPHQGGYSKSSWPESAAGRNGKVNPSKKEKGRKRDPLSWLGDMHFHDPDEVFRQPETFTPHKMLVFAVIQGAYADAIWAKRALFLSPSMKTRAERDLGWIMADFPTAGFSFKECCDYLDFSSQQQKKLKEFFIDTLTEILQKRPRKIGGWGNIGVSQERKLVQWEL